MRPGIMQSQREKICPPRGRRRRQNVRQRAQNEEGNERCYNALHNTRTIRTRPRGQAIILFTQSALRCLYIKNGRTIHETEGVFYVCLSLIAYCVVFIDLLSWDSRSPASRGSGDDFFRRARVRASLLYVIGMAPPPEQPGNTARAFGEIVDLHQRSVYRYLVRCTGKDDDAQELFQETFLRAYRAYADLPADANHRAWLFSDCHKIS